MPAPTKIYVACSGISGKGGGASTKMGGYKKNCTEFGRGMFMLARV